MFAPHCTAKPPPPVPVSLCYTYRGQADIIVASIIVASKNISFQPGAEYYWATIAL